MDELKIFNTTPDLIKYLKCTGLTKEETIVLLKVTVYALATIDDEDLRSATIQMQFEKMKEGHTTQ